MKAQYRLLLATLLILGFNHLAAAGDYTPGQLVPMDLLPLQSRETRWADRLKIENMNKRTLATLSHTTVKRVVRTARGTRLNAISKSVAEKIVTSIDRHPVVSGYQYEKYNRPDVQIGFCFGRATYVHLALLKMGVNKDAIRKIWAVGPMSTGVEWAFHVATLVKGEQPGQWWAIDSFPGQVLEAKDWFKYMQQFNGDRGNLRVYVTEPQKFSVSLGNYDRVQMGLDLDRKQDWYRHYFVDLLNWFRDPRNTLRSVGLMDLRSKD